MKKVSSSRKVLQLNKPLYKRIWVYVAIVLILIVVSSTSQKNNTTVTEQDKKTAAQAEIDRKNRLLEERAVKLGEMCSTDSKTTIYQPGIAPKPSVFKDAAVSESASNAINIAQKVFDLTSCETFIANLRYGNLGGSVDIGAVNLRLSKDQYAQAKSQAEKDKRLPGEYLLPNTVTHIDPRLEVSLSHIIYIEP